MILLLRFPWFGKLLVWPSSFICTVLILEKRNVSHVVMLTCREAFQCRVLLCVWHIRRAWIRSLLKKCRNFDMQREMFKHLGWILYCTRSGPNAVDAIEEFMQVFVDQCDFMDYFRIRWLPSIGICPFMHEVLLCWKNFFSHKASIFFLHIFLVLLLIFVISILPVSWQMAYINFWVHLRKMNFQ